MTAEQMAVDTSGVVTGNAAAALRDLKSLADYAYTTGYHEMGYDPWRVTVEELSRMRRALQAIYQATAPGPEIDPLALHFAAAQGLGIDDE